MGRLPAAASSIVLLGQAPMTALLAWPLLDERPRPGQAIGGMLVLAGIMVVNLTRQRPEPTEPISP
jgi:drug/metabolite transporter (DMT)-like permease